MNQPGDKDITLNQLINPDLAVRRAFNEINSESDILVSTDGSIDINEVVDSEEGYITKDLSVNFDFLNDVIAGINSKDDSIIVQNYSDGLLINPSPTNSINILVLTDTVNNGGLPSEYKLYPNGFLMWQASIKI